MTNQTPVRVEIPRASADEQAARCWAANLKALRELQPRLADSIQALPARVEWVYGRDGTLTAMDSPNQWHAGTSLPRAAAAAILRKLEVRCGGACFLCPQHAAQIRVGLDLLRPEQFLIVVMPEVRPLRIALQCENFAADIAAHRLFFAWGEGWAAQIESLFAQYPGLSLPSQFIRLPMLEETAATAMVRSAQAAFENVNRQRGTIQNLLREKPAPSSLVPKRLCVLVPGTFNLWADTTAALLTAVESPAATAAEMRSVVRLDYADPLNTSPLALAMAAAACDSVLAADLGRMDVGDPVPAWLAWVTWVTSGRIPPYNPACVRDGLILADASWQAVAESAGWPADRIAIGGWPSPAAPLPPAPAAVAAILADTRPLEVPADVAEMSSHRLLWELVCHELSRDPFLAAGDAHTYLRQRLQRLSIPLDSVNTQAFIQRLVEPAFMQGVARYLIGQKLNLRLYGEGWEKVEEFRAHAAGPIRSREDFAKALSESAVLVHAWLNTAAHPIDVAGRPVVRAGGRGREHFLADLVAQLRKPAIAAVSGSALSRTTIERLLK